jgi:heme-degrading monooxygenase HmoA
MRRFLPSAIGSLSDLDSIEQGLYPVILEVAVLNIKNDLTADFEAAFEVASSIIAAMPGYVSHELQRCIETKNRYILLVRWQTLEDHTVGFRQSSQYQEWRALLHHFYDPFPVVEH